MEQNNFSIAKITENILKVSGILDAAGAEKLNETMVGDVIYVLDFEDVTSVNFAALRATLNMYKAGKRFSIINATSEVAELFEDTGVSSFVGVCRKPRKLNLGEYDEFGAGFLSKAFNSKDGDAMIKVYSKMVPKWMAFQEKVRARDVMLAGIPTPLVGKVYEDGELTAIDFERIEGKRSLSRIISEEPERMEEVTIKFAKMCKELHSTPCDTNKFPDRSIFYRNAVARSTKLDKDVQAKILKFLDTVPKATTCLHGDMQPSNIITNGKEDLWIDLSDFGYGYPLFDLGMWYFLSKLNDEERSQHVFHLGVKEMAKIWEIFAKEYFGEEEQNADAKVLPFAALHMVYLGETYGYIPEMFPAIKGIAEQFM